MSDGTTVKGAGSAASQMTTGQLFGALWKQLVEAGVPADTASDIVRASAIDEIRESGFVIKGGTNA